jgi:branched-chain amino acid transport system substrate-binding protein
MSGSATPTTAGVRRRRPLGALLVASALVAAACSSGSDSSESTSPATEAPTEADPAVTEPAEADPVDSEPADSEPADSEPAEPEPTDTDATDAAESDGFTDFPELPPPTGETIRVALVNSEGSPGLDFPDVRENVGATVDYLNEHGGLGNRPIELVNCTVKGSPETSQACAQEVAGKDVELVLLGLDLFPDYATYTASGLPVIGMLPILPADYTSNALFLTGGNATTNAAIAAAADEHFGAETVAIVSADNAGANATEAALTASLDVAGITHFTIKGGDNETDAGYQGLMRQAAEGDPDLIVSLYADAGCVGTIRGRASLGIEVPVISTAICADKAVIDAVGDDALGWTFVGIQTDEDTPEKLILQEMLSPALGVPPEEVDPSALGLGGLGAIMTMSLADYSSAMVAAGTEVTGQSLFEYLGTTPELKLWPAGSLVECGQASDYPSICAYTYPFAEYQEGGGVVTVVGLEAVSSIDYLP